MKKLIIAAILAASSTTMFAQGGTNSPYSMYGFGTLAEQTSGFNRGMDGLALGFREHNQINYLNPASYSNLDSLTFIFDAGVSFHKTNYSEGGRKVNRNNASFEYVVAAFRLAKRVGFSFGLIPYSNVGYSFTGNGNVNDHTSTIGPSTTYTNTYSGDGGLRQVYIGAGWEPVKGLSVGANVSYFWGKINRSITNSYSESYVNTLSKRYISEVTSFKFDFGLQYEARLGGNNRVTLGLIYGLGHKLGSDPKCIVTSTNSQTSVAHSDTLMIENGLSIPHSFGGGLVWNHKNRLKLGFDYQVQKWSKLDTPVLTYQNEKPTYHLVNGLYKDRQKMTFGGDYCANERSHSFFGRMHYRAGFSYATPYIKVNDQNGPKEFSVSAGVGIPIVNSYNNRSMLNISAQWTNRSASGLIKENSFRINVGLTFNERWFAKFKVD